MKETLLGYKHEKIYVYPPPPAPIQGITEESITFFLGK